MTTSSAAGQKLWNYCNVLRDAGLEFRSPKSGAPPGSLGNAVQLVRSTCCGINPSAKMRQTS